MGNLCVSDQKKYNKIRTNTNESEGENKIKLDVFDINIAKQKYTFCQNRF